MSDEKNLALIVEDQESIAMLWQRNLEKLHMTVKWAMSMADAKRIAAEIPPPDLILLDLKLGDSKAEQTLHAIDYFKEKNPDVVIIVLSGFITPDIAALAAEKGAHGVQEKLNIHSGRVLLQEIEKATASASPKAQVKMKQQRSLISELTNLLHML